MKGHARQCDPSLPWTGMMIRLRKSVLSCVICCTMLFRMSSSCFTSWKHSSTLAFVQGLELTTHCQLQLVVRSSRPDRSSHHCAWQTQNVAFQWQSQLYFPISVPSPPPPVRLLVNPLLTGKKVDFGTDFSLNFFIILFFRFLFYFWAGKTLKTPKTLKPKTLHEVWFRRALLPLSQKKTPKFRTCFLILPKIPFLFLLSFFFVRRHDNKRSQSQVASPRPRGTKERSTKGRGEGDSARDGPSSFPHEDHWKLHVCALVGPCWSFDQVSVHSPEDSTSVGDSQRPFLCIIRRRVAYCGSPTSSLPVGSRNLAQVSLCLKMDYHLFASLENSSLSSGPCPAQVSLCLRKRIPTQLLILRSV